MEGLSFGWAIVLFGRDYNGTFIIVISLILYFIHSHKFSGRNIKGLYVKWLLMSKQWPFPHYIDVCHGNVDYFKWKNVSMIYCWWIKLNLSLLQFSCSSLKHLRSFYSVHLHLEKIRCHFPKGWISDLVVVWERVITNFIKWIMIKMRN